LDVGDIQVDTTCVRVVGTVRRRVEAKTPVLTPSPTVKIVRQRISLVNEAQKRLVYTDVQWIEAPQLVRASNRDALRVTLKP
jgi:hypothetical protein